METYRGYLIKRLYDEFKVVTTNSKLNQLSISEDLLDEVMKELRDESNLYDNDEDYRNRVNKIEEDFKKGNIKGLIKVFCNEGYGIDIEFNHNSIDFYLLDVMIDWEDIPDYDLMIMNTWLNTYRGLE